MMGPNGAAKITLNEKALTLRCRGLDAWDRDQATFNWLMRERSNFSRA